MTRRKGSTAIVLSVAEIGGVEAALDRIGHPDLIAALADGRSVRVPPALLPPRVRAEIGRWRMCLVYPDGSVEPA